MWTHANALWAARVNASHEHLLPDDCHLIIMPLFHANALAYSLLPTLWTGAWAVLAPLGHPPVRGGGAPALV